MSARDILVPLTRVPFPEFDPTLGAPGPSIADRMREFWRQCTTLPPASKRAADLSPAERVALAYAAGVPCDLHVDGMIVTLATTHEVAITDREGGGFLVAVGEELPAHELTPFTWRRCSNA